MYTSTSTVSSILLCWACIISLYMYTGTIRCTLSHWSRQFIFIEELGQLNFRAKPIEIETQAAEGHEEEAGNGAGKTCLNIWA